MQHTRAARCCPLTQFNHLNQFRLQDKINVDQAFTRMAKLIKDKRKDEADPDSKVSHNIDLNNNVQKKKSGGCC